MTIASNARLASAAMLFGLMVAMPGVGASGPPCPPGATPEGEPCDESGQGIINGGCNTRPAAFLEVACGETLCGEAWALDGFRDTDNFLMPVSNVETVSATLTAAFPALVWGTNTGTGIDCDVLYVGEGAVIEAGETVTVTLPFPIADDDVLWWFVGATIFDGLPCGSEGDLGNDYVVSWSCAAAVCPEVGDLNGDGVIDFEDLLVVLANFGPCP